MLEAYEGNGTYDRDQRILLMNHLADAEQRKHPWPAKLDSAFGIEDPEEATTDSGTKAGTAPGDPPAAPLGGGGDRGGDAGEVLSPKGGSMPGRGRGGSGRSSRGGRGVRGRFGGRKRTVAGPAAEAPGGIVLLGSPMVDATLEDTQGLRKVIEVLKKETGMSTGGFQIREASGVLFLGGGGGGWWRMCSIAWCSGSSRRRSFVDHSSIIRRSFDLAPVPCWSEMSGCRRLFHQGCS